MSNTETRKLKIVRTSNPPLGLEEGEAIHVGVDVHKASYSVALYRARESGENCKPNMSGP